MKVVFQQLAFLVTSPAAYQPETELMRVVL